MIGNNSPDHIKELLADIKELSGSDVKWEIDVNLPGLMQASFNNGVPVIHYRDYTEACATEELIHLKLDLLGYPRMSCLVTLNLERQTAEILHNVLQHRIIYPKLEQFGYSPRKSECAAIEKQLSTIEAVDLKRLSNEPFLRSLYSMFYVRAKLECEDNQLNHRVEQLYAKEELANILKVAYELKDRIENSSGNTVDDYRATIESCKSILGLSDNVKVTTL